MGYWQRLRNQLLLWKAEEAGVVSFAWEVTLEFEVGLEPELELLWEQMKCRIPRL